MDPMWYVDDAGNYLICLSPAPAYTCGGNYESYTLRADKTYERDAFVVCTS